MYEAEQSNVDGVESKVAVKNPTSAEKEGSRNTPTRENVDVSCDLNSDDSTLDSPNDGRNENKRPSESQEEAEVPAKEKKMHRKKKMKREQGPSIEFVENMDLLLRKEITIPLIRNLVVHIFDSTESLNWVKVNNAYKIQKVVVCFVTGLCRRNFFGDDLGNFEGNYIPLKEIKVPQGLNHFHDTYEHLIKTTIPGDKESIFLDFHAFTNVPLTKKEKRQILNSSKENKITLWDLLLPNLDMKNHGYAMHSSSSSPGEQGNPLHNSYFETKQFDHEGSHTFAMDCEFCKTSSGKALTRISLIDFQGNVVLDSLVKPEEEIIDYVTKYSGITEEMLKDVKTSLSELQEKLLAIVSSDDILIGHSLESDLNILKIKHPKIIDTTYIYDHGRGPPLKPSLKWLSSKYLNREIQQGESNGKGHSPVEDAMACLDLVKLKLNEGLQFGKNIYEIPLFARLNKKERTVTSSVVDYFHVAGKCSDEDQNHLRRIQVHSDNEAVHYTQAKMEKSDLVITKLRELEFTIKKSLATNESDETLVPTAVKQLNDNLDEIYRSLPSNSAFIVITSPGITESLDKLMKTKREFQKLEREGKDVSNLDSRNIWDSEKASALQREVEIAREAACFISVKP